jgi:hypothetical protein
MSNNIGYDKYLFTQSDYIRNKRVGLNDKVYNYTDQNLYIQSLHNSSSTPRNELSNPCILLKANTSPISDASMVTCVFKLTDCQLKYYISKGVTGSPKTYTLTSKTASLDATYSCQLQLYTSNADISTLNSTYKTNLPLSYSYLMVTNVLLKSNDIFGLPITIL